MIEQKITIFSLYCASCGTHTGDNILKRLRDEKVGYFCDHQCYADFYTRRDVAQVAQVALTESVNR